MTAILSALTPHGFVIGSDSLRGNLKNPAESITDAQKIFFIKNEHVHFAFAWAGTTQLVVNGAEFSFIEASKRVFSITPPFDYEA